MRRIGYQVLGFAVWQAIKLYLRRALPSRRVVAAGVVGAVLAVAVVAGAKREPGS